MKIAELRKIIKEEISKVLSEGGPMDALGSAYGAFQTPKPPTTTTFKKFKSPSSSLEKLEQSVRDELGINSTDPIYKNSTIRKKWMDKISNGVKQIGVDVVKSNWKSISDKLEDDNFHQLRLFLVLSLKLDKGDILYYTNKSMDKSNSDRDAIKDFLTYKIV